MVSLPLDTIKGIQFLPTSEDIKNEAARKLAARLKSDSDEKTLSNILEWQERNIRFWEDRQHLFILVFLLMIASFVLLPIQQDIRAILIIMFIVCAFFSLTYTLYLLPLIGFIVVLYTLFYSINFPAANNMLPISVLIALSGILGGIIALLIYLILKYRNIKSFQPEFKPGDTFKLSLSVDKILKYRLAICRDYAKLTAALLLNLYPNNEIYFITIPQHVAAGIKLNDKIYVLDQRLPIETLGNWLLLWKEKFNKKELKADVFKITYSNEKLKTEKVDCKRLKDTVIPKINLDNFINKLVYKLNVKKSTRKDKPDFEISFKNYALEYEEDEIIEFSLIESIRNKLEKELCDNIMKVSEIDLIQDKKDLILEVYFK